MPAVSTMVLNALVMSGERAIEVITFTQLQSSFYLSRLNSMMDSWSNERMMIYQLSQTSFALTASQGSYTIGNGGNFNMTRPTRLVDPCFIRDSDGFDSELEIINMVAYGRIVEKTADGSYPHYIAYDYGFSATSTGTIYFWPEPQASLSTFINTLQPIQTFSTMSVNLLLPPGYQRAIESNFAIESAIGGAGMITPELQKIARESKAAIKTTNAPAPISRLDYGISGQVRSNILTGP